MTAKQPGAESAALLLFSDVVSLSKGDDCAVARDQVVVTCVCKSFASQNLVQLNSGLPWINF